MFVADLMFAGGLIASFVAGVIAGSLVGHAAAGNRRAAVLGLVAVLLAASFALSVPAATALAAPPLLAVAMGAANAVFETNGEVRIAVTYMTGTLVKMGQNIAHRLTHTDHPRTWPRYGALWASMAGGACLGGGAYQMIGLASVAGAAVPPP